MAQNESNKHKILYQIFENIDIGLLAIDSNQEICLFNHQAEEYTGFKKSEVRNKHFLKAFANNSSISGALSKVIEQKSSAGNCVRESLANSEINRNLLFRTTLLPQPKGKFEGAILYIKPAIELKYPVLPLPQPGNETFEKIMADIVHEIRNPLGGILGFTALLEKDLARMEPEKKMVRKIIYAAKGLEKVVNSLSIIARNHSKEYFKTVVLQDYLSNACENCEQRYKTDSQIYFSKNFPAMKIGVSIEPLLFEQLCSTLLEQAKKSLIRGGTIDLELRQRKKEVIFTISLKHANFDDSHLLTGTKYKKYLFHGLKRILIQKIVVAHGWEVDFPGDNQDNILIIIRIPNSKIIS